MSHLLYSKRGHDSEDEDYSQTDVTTDDDYTDEEETDEDDYTEDEENDDDEEEEEEEEEEDGIDDEEDDDGKKDEATVITKAKELEVVKEKETVSEQVQYHDLDPEEAKEKRIQEHRDYRRKMAEDPSFVPYVGLFWGHDDRYRDDAFTETRAVSENLPHFSGNTSKSTSIKQGHYDKSMDPLMYKKWDHSGWEELQRLDEEDERRRQELILAGELQDGEDYKPNRNYRQQYSSRGRGYRQRGGYSNQGQHNQHRPRYQQQQSDRQEEWPSLSAPPPDQMKDDISTKNASSHNLGQVDSTSVQTETGWGQVDSTIAQTETGWGQEDSTSTQAETGRGQVDSTSTPTETGWGQVDSTSTQTETGWGQVDSTSVQAETGWGQPDVNTAQAENSWNQADITTAQPEAPQVSDNNGWGQENITASSNENKWADDSALEDKTEKNGTWEAAETSTTTWKNTSNTEWSSPTDHDNRSNDYHNRRANNSRFIPSEERASSSWANSDLSKSSTSDRQFTNNRNPRSQYNNNNNNNSSSSSSSNNNNNRRNNYRSTNDYQRNNYRNEKKEDWDASAVAESQGWATTSSTTMAATDQDAWAAPSMDNTIKNEPWDAPSKEVNDSWKETSSWNTTSGDATVENTTLDSSKWDTPVVEKTPISIEESWSVSNANSWGAPSKDPVAASWDAPVPTINTPKVSIAEKSDSWNTAEPVSKEESQGADWSEPVEAKKEDTEPSGWGPLPTSNGIASSWAPSENKQTTGKSQLDETKQQQQENVSSWSQADWKSEKTTVRKSRGYLSQKMDEVPVVEQKAKVEEVVTGPKVVEVVETSTWSALRNQNDEDSDVEIILEAEEEPDWLKGEQVLGMTAPYDTSKNSPHGKSSPKATKSNHRSFESSPRSDINRKVNGRKPRRNFEENWRARDDNEDAYRNTPPAMYYPPQQMNAYVPMIPNANGNPMYAMSFPMGASTGGSASPNHDSDGSPHQKYYTSPPMMNPNNMQLPPGYEANGMVYYGMDPNAMYPPQQFYYYMPMASTNEGTSPIMYANEVPRTEDDGWGPSPEVNEEQWSKPSPANDKNRNPHSMPYNPSYYYYQNPY